MDACPESEAPLSRRAAELDAHELEMATSGGATQWVPSGSVNRYRAAHLRHGGYVMMELGTPTGHVAPAPAEGTEEKSPPGPRHWVRWAFPVATLVLGIAIGAATGAGDPTQSLEYQALEQRMEDQADDAQGRITALANQSREARTEVREAQEASARRAAEFDERERALKGREDAVADREVAAMVPEEPGPNSAPEPAQPSPAGPDLSAAQDNALEKAREYLSFTSFSRSGLIGQLEYEGFAAADATRAIDQLTVDWNSQAAMKAAEYLDVTAFSRSGLIDQLLYDGFTREQAEHGASASGL
jgi:colicin import membrane protein